MRKTRPHSTSTGLVNYGIKLTEWTRYVVEENPKSYVVFDRVVPLSFLRSRVPMGRRCPLMIWKSQDTERYPRKCAGVLSEWIRTQNSNIRT